MADSRHQTHWATHFLKVKLELSGRSAPRSDNDTIKSEAVFGIHPLQLVSQILRGCS